MLLLFCRNKETKKKRDRNLHILTQRDTHTHTHYPPPDQTRPHHNTQTQMYVHTKGTGRALSGKNKLRRTPTPGDNEEEETESKAKREVLRGLKSKHPSFSVIYQFFFSAVIRIGRKETAHILDLIRKQTQNGSALVCGISLSLTLFFFLSLPFLPFLSSLPLPPLLNLTHWHSSSHLHPPHSSISHSSILIRSSKY